MTKKNRNIVLLLSLSVLLCFTATSCLSILGSVVGGLLFRFSDELGGNVIEVYGEDNELSVTFEKDKMLAIWDSDPGYSYILTVRDGSGEKEYIPEKQGYFDMTSAGYTYAMPLQLSLKASKLGAVVGTYSYSYGALSEEQYEEYTTPVQEGFTGIDKYIATRAEWFDFFSYLVVFRDGAKQETDEDGQTVYNLESDCYLAYDYMGYEEYADLSNEDAFSNEVYCAIEAYEDSASYAYSYELGEDNHSANLYLRFYYSTDPVYETDSYARYSNATKLGDVAHYSYGDHIRHFPIDDVQETVSVASSDQLYFALKKGCRPIPKENSNAYYLYEEMRSILQNINADEDSDYNKLHYIYDYIVDTVVYDYVFTEKTMNSKSVSSDDLFRYKCLYLEGVFGYQTNGAFSVEKRVAICDGLSKAYLCMAKIEGINCCKVSGTVSGEGHAWNKVYLEGKWYMVDTTWGNELASSGTIEYLSHDYFLVKDDTSHVESPYINYPSADSNYSVQNKQMDEKTHHKTFTYYRYE